MTSAPTLSQVLDLIGVTRDQFKGWLKQDLLHHAKLPATTQGVARTMTPFAAKNLAYLKALIDVGLDGRDAASRAHVFAARADLQSWFIYDPVGKREAYFGDVGAKTSIAVMAKTLGKSRAFRAGERSESVPATRFVVIHLAGIAQGIDALFDAPRS